MSQESLLRRFPKLNNTQWGIYSASSNACNCAGFVIGFEANEMWPSDDPYSCAYWPEGIPRELSLNNFQLAYEKLGFRVCEDGSFDESVIKIVVYEYANHEPSHVAWQHASRRHWHSKIGFEEDIIHELDALSGPKKAYGDPALFMHIDLEGFRQLWHQNSASRTQRTPYELAHCERELGLAPQATDRDA